MRPIKQSNSMKELLKKLKRHDTLVLASGVVVASLLCGGFVYVTTPAISADVAKAEVKRDSLGVQKKASDQLHEIENYLERLDKVVTDSQELVKEVQTVQNEQKELTEKTIETQKNIETQKTTSSEKSTNTNSTKVVEKISGLDKELDSIHSEIQTTNTQIKELKSSMDKGGNKDSNKDKEDFAQITNALNDIKKSCDKSGSDVSVIVDELKNNKGENVEQQKSMITSLETIEKTLEKVETKETLSRMESDLRNTQNTYVTMLDEVEKSVNKTTDNVKKVGDKIGKVAEDIDVVENSVSNVEKNVGNVENGLNTVARDVNNVASGVNNVANGVSNVETGVNKMAGSVSNVENGITQVAGGVSNVENGVNEVRKAQETTDTKMDELKTDFGTFRGEVGNVSGLVGDVQGHLTNVENQIVSVQSEINEARKSMGNTNAKIDQLAGKVEQVFQCSDSNRRKLASVLFETSGYEAAEGATFEELIEAVKLIPAHVINSGKVKYEHHYHKDGNGNVVADRTTQRGGCFTRPVCHVHTDERYKVDTKYHYRPNFVKKKTDKHEDIIMICVRCYAEMKISEAKEHGHYTYDAAEAKGMWIYDTATEKTLICPKDDKVAEYYVPACGYSHGAISRAIIEYPQVYTDTENVKNTLTTSMISESKGIDINEEIFSLDTYEDGTLYDENDGDDEDNNHEQDEIMPENDKPADNQVPEGQVPGNNPRQDQTPENQIPENTSQEDHSGESLPGDNKPREAAAVSDGNSEG